jgi:hypothetical protein
MEINGEGKILRWDGEAKAGMYMTNAFIGVTMVDWKLILFKDKLTEEPLSRYNRPLVDWKLIINNQLLIERIISIESHEEDHNVLPIKKNGEQIMEDFMSANNLKEEDIYSDEELGLVIDRLYADLHEKGQHMVFLDLVEAQVFGNYLMNQPGKFQDLSHFNIETRVDRDGLHYVLIPVHRTIGLLKEPEKYVPTPKLMKSIARSGLRTIAKGE